MDNAAILSANGKEYNGIDAFRANNENIRQDAVNPRIRPAQSDNNQGGNNTGIGEADLVELSRESMELAANVENADMAAARVETPEARPVEETLMEPANANLVTAVGTGPETTLSTVLTAAAAQNEAQNEAQNTIINTNTATTGETPETVQVTTLETTNAEQVAAVNATTPEPENTAVETVPEMAAASTAVPEQPTGAGTGPEQPVVPTLEEQANELSRINSSIASVNNLAAAPSGPEPATPAESTRNEQQILLQQLGSQLAQVIPPASVFSVVG